MGAWGWFGFYSPAGLWGCPNPFAKLVLISPPLALRAALLRSCALANTFLLLVPHIIQDRIVLSSRSGESEPDPGAMAGSISTFVLWRTGRPAGHVTVSHSDLHIVRPK